jgi:hypothetical protein
MENLKRVFAYREKRDMWAEKSLRREDTATRTVNLKKFKKKSRET